MPHADTLRILAKLGPEKTADLVERMAHAITTASDGIVDEGDCAFLGSTNHLNILRDVTQEWFELRYLYADLVENSA